MASISHARIVMKHIVLQSSCLDFHTGTVKDVMASLPLLRRHIAVFLKLSYFTTSFKEPKDVKYRFLYAR
jgi:hypothetical protein